MRGGRGYRARRVEIVDDPMDPVIRVVALGARARTYVKEAR